ncbi:MAG: UDP-N-acetylmuramoyl-L-alanyl-D-glutamate--2,6-diaminopimelate ligase [Candidatus Eisenbacteria bacterium]|nr:UDP-N-acetylmuramoyl-L-alanyl-D-glutamate--2,6-diaminopimelate ligase [Candidatus Eisenbacteria bacterium]
MGICCDTRKLAPGEIFVCLRGQERDSHALAAEAYARGALLVVGEDETVGGDGPYLQVEDSRKAVALLADRFHDHPSARMTVLAATGTNGKTSTTWMCEAVFREAGIPAAVLGTLGVGSPGPQGDPSLLRSLGHTTPEAPDLQATLHELAAGGVRAVAMEVSSHGLELRRTFATRFVVAIFTNLTPDHLDFHHSMEAYAEAKRRLFIATERGCDETPLIAVVAGDDPWTRTVLAGSKDRIIRFGRDRAHDIHPVSLELGGHGIRMRVRHPAGETDITSPLLGEFQVDNLLAAFGATVAAGIEPEVAARGLGRLRGIPGRMERVDAGQPFLVVVDYAHTPDALRRALASLRPFTTGRLIVVFGCGGERDRAKRPEMGREAGLGADRVILTDDNPRREEPGVIRGEARVGLAEVAASFLELGDRSAAIARALAEAEPGDAVLIAGKGAEGYQIRGTEQLPFDDREVARSALTTLLAERGGQFEAAHFSLPEIALQSGGVVRAGQSASSERRFGYRTISTDSRRVTAGDFFVALRGERFDAHDFLSAVVERGVEAALVDRPLPDAAWTQVVVDDTLRALQRWGGARRAAWGATGPLVGLTGSSGKTTTKDLLAHLLGADGPVWATYPGGEVRVAPRAGARRSLGPASRSLGARSPAGRGRAAPAHDLRPRNRGHDCSGGPRRVVPDGNSLHYPAHGAHRTLPPRTRRASLRARGVGHPRGSGP